MGGQQLFYVVSARLMYDYPLFSDAFYILLCFIYSLKGSLFIDFLVLNCSLMFSPFFARCSPSSVYFIPSTPSAPLFRTTCRYALLRLSLDRICSIRLLVSMRPFLSVSLDLTIFYPIGYGRCYLFCNTRPTQTYWLFTPSLHLHYRDFFTTMGSADFSQFVVTRLMEPLWDLHA